MQRIVITGAGRGLGLEFCRQYLERGDAVIGVARDVAASTELQALRDAWPQRLHLAEFDVTDFGAVDGFASGLSVMHVDILVNNAGAIGPETHKGESGQNLGTLDPRLLSRLFEVNAVSPVYLTRALLPSLRLSARPRAFVMGSTVGLPRETFGDYYGYRMSKAAAQVAFATLARDLQDTGIVAATVCPGWVRTRMGGPNASTAPEDSVAQMIQLMEDFPTALNGRFVDAAGRPLDI
jgi:NAD(P)-dependent dehydrogenase (short-subunit alcohol dehydrogenase family)